MFFSFSHSEAALPRAPWLLSVFAPVIGTILISAAVFSTADAAMLRLGDQVVPVEQRVELELDPSQPDYTGRTRTELEVVTETNSFRFHAETMDLQRVELTRDGKPVASTYEALADAVIEVTTSEKLSAGRYTLEVEFADEYNTNAVALYRMASGDGFLFTQFEADDAREAFPCWDEPGFKIPFQLVMTVPNGQTPVTNTPVIEKEEQGGKTRYTFAKTKPIPTYLIAIAVGDFEYVPMEGLGVPGGIYTVAGQGHLAATAAEETARVLRAMEEYFERPYPYAKLDFIAVPEFWPGAMEHPGAITYADRVLLVAPEDLTVRKKRRMVGIIAHELAHQWFGNLVTMEWWDDLWLNESFADWIADKVTHQLYPNLAADIASEKDGQSVMVSDARVTTQPIQKPVVDTNGLLQGIGIAYNKGKAVLRMFEGWVGEEEFRRGVIDYLEANAWGNATSDDLWAALAQRSSPILPEAMATFVEQPGFPLIDFQPNGDGTLTLRQRRFRTLGTEVEDLLWKIPMTIEYPKDGTVASKTILFDKKETKVELGLDRAPEWILPKAAAQGYYRWILPESMYKDLARRSSEFLTPLERIDLLGNSIALLQAGRLSGPDYLETLAGFSADSDPHVLAAIPDGLRLIRDSLLRQEDSRAFEAWVRGLLRPTVERIGIEPQPGEAEAISLLRPQWVRWLGREGKDPGALDWAERSFRKFMKNPGNVDPSLVDAMLSIHLAGADDATFREIRTRFETSNTPVERGTFLGAMGDFRDPAIRARALDYMLTDSVRSSEMFSIAMSMQNDDPGRDLVLEWIMNNWAPFSKKVPGIYLPMMPRAAEGCSQARLDHATEFFIHPARFVPGADVTLAKTEEQVAECIRLHDREAEAVGRYLNQRVGEPLKQSGQRETGEEN